MIQLLLLLAVFRVFRVEQAGAQDSGFFLMCCLAVGAFAVHYWLPFRFKENFWISVSLLGAVLLLDPRVATGVLASGAIFFLVLSSRLRYWHRVGLLVTACAVAMLMRVYTLQINRFLGAAYLPEAFWPAFGSIFLFRMIIYAHCCPS